MDINETLVNTIDVKYALRTIPWSNKGRFEYDERGFPSKSLGEEVFAIFDEQDKPVRFKTREVLCLRSQCHGLERITGVYHRGTNVFLVNNGQLYVPFRSASKDLYPSCGDVSISEHVLVGETYEEGAVRGASEELGISIDATDLEVLSERKVDDRLQNEWCAYFLLDYVGEITLNEEEVASGKWYSIDALNQGDAKAMLQFRDDHWPALRELLCQLQ